MSNKVDYADGICVCGEPFKTKFKKPNAIVSSFSVLRCKECDSTFTLKCFVKKGSWPREYGISLVSEDITSKGLKLYKIRNNAK